MKAFLDTNILFSAAKSDGAIRKLIELLIAAGHECWTDGFVAEEACRNLAAKAPQAIAYIESLLSRLRVAAAQPSGAQLDADLPLPEKDRPVLAAAIYHGCAALMTGDRAHFGRLYGKTLHGVTIYSPRSLADALLP